MSDRRTVPADASSPDPDRAGQAVFGLPPDWVVHVVSRLLLFLLRHLAAFRQRRAPHVPDWWVSVPEYPAGSAQELAASLRGTFGNLITSLCWLEGIGPGHKDWVYLSRTILAFGGTLAPLDGKRHRRSWWNQPEIVPGMAGDSPAEPSAASLLAQRVARDHLPLAAQPGPAGANGAAIAPALLALRAGAGSGNTPSHASLSLGRRLATCLGPGPPARAGAGPPFLAAAGPPTACP